MSQPLPSGDGQAFHGLGIAPKLLEILGKHNYQVPTPIQHKSIPVSIEGKDMIGIAQTGTGKTLAFGVPMLQRLAIHKGRGLALLPTRELALQVDETLHKIGKDMGIRTAVLIGGASMRQQIDNLRRNPHVIVATPGRLIDHLQQKTVDLSDVKILVLDEADRMLDMGFLPQINRILRTVPKERQTMLFSATMPEDIVSIAANHMKTPVRVEIARQGSLADTVAQEMYVVRKDQKIRLLDKVLEEHKGSVLVFTRTKFSAKKIARAVRGMGHGADEIHSNRSLNQRKAALEGFKTGKHRVLVATDIAARGIDVTGIELVINFDVPENPDDYVHRIGRTGRAGRLGKAITFAQPDQGSEVRDIERLTRKMLPITPMPKDLPPDRPMHHEAERPDLGVWQPRSGSRGGYQGRSGGHGGSRGGYQGRSGGQGGYAPRQGGSGSHSGGHSQASSSSHQGQSQGASQSGSHGRSSGFGGKKGGKRRMPPKKFYYAI
ncbi:MAG: DEAD/DEAH box helicase [Patescibacteria group bacterium]|nr:MAG: DEAD/DEAH box helicase [Patescibacteria group bacterium]